MTKLIVTIRNFAKAPKKPTAFNKTINIINLTKAFTLSDVIHGVRIITCLLGSIRGGTVVKVLCYYTF
jgi:hypothetical protein